MITVDDLKQIVMLGYLTDEMLEKLVPITDLLLFDENEFIFRQGEQSDRLYMLKEGKVLLELEVSDNITVFAPTDEAFAALPEGTVESLLQPENRDQLVAILTYHVLPRELRSTDLPGRTIPVRTLNTADLLRVNKSHGAVTVDGATVVSADIQAANGVIHVIDSVLLPDGDAH